MYTYISAWRLYVWRYEFLLSEAAVQIDWVERQSTIKIRILRAKTYRSSDAE